MEEVSERLKAFSASVQAGRGELGVASLKPHRHLSVAAQSLSLACVWWGFFHDLDEKCSVRFSWLTGHLARG